MKRVIFVILFIFMSSVSAKENKIYFTGDEDRLYYKTENIDEDIFIKHLDMLPGKEFRDELIIENKTLYTYKLYLKAKESIDNDFLDNIIMQIYLENNLVYDGNANGLNYNNNGLEEAIYIGEYKANSSDKLIVMTKLRDDYKGDSDNKISDINWEFYASYDDLVIPINPDTSADKKIVFLVVLCGILCVILLLIFFMSKDKIKLKQ